MAVETMIGELMGTFPRLPYLHAVQLINRAWTKVRDSRLWSWQFVSNASLFVPAAIQEGSVTTVSGSEILTVDANAAAAINAAGLNPPLASSVVGLGRQIRIGNGTSWATIYNISAWDSATNQLTLDQPFAGESQSSASYQIFRSYFVAPPRAGISETSDGQFIRFITLANRASGYTVRGKRLWLSQEQLNTFDPQRASTGDPSAISPMGRNSASQSYFELYPHPITAMNLSVSYYSRWPDVSGMQEFPQVPYGLETCVADLAKVFACSWATANVATFAELAQTNWIAAQMAYRQDHMDGLKQCVRNDNEIMPHLPFLQGRKSQVPLGGEFLQSHDLSSLLQ